MSHQEICITCKIWSRHVGMSVSGRDEHRQFELAVARRWSGRACRGNRELGHQVSLDKFLFLWFVSSRDGRPVPRGTLPAGKGGFPAPPRAVGRGGFPAPPRPVKMIKTAGKLRGKINTRISTFSKRGNKWWNNITTLNNAQSSLSIGYARESKKWKYFVLFLLTGHQTLFSKICQRMK